MASAYGVIEHWSRVSRCWPGLGMAQATIWIISYMIFISSLSLHLSVSPCSLCVPQYPKRDIVLLWTTLTQAIARLGSSAACAAGLEHCQSIAITKNGLYALLGFSNMIIPVVARVAISLQRTILSSDLAINHFMDTGPTLCFPSLDLVACITDSMRCRVTCCAYPDLNRIPSHQAFDTSLSQQCQVNTTTLANPITSEKSLQSHYSRTPTWKQS